MGWGRKPTCTCGTCRRCRERDRARERWRNMTPEERRAVIARRDPERVRRQDRERHARRSSDLLYIAKRRARAALNAAIRRGEIKRGPCESCGKPDAHAHHEDYNKPLEVRWFCPLCHALEHQEV